MVQPALRPGAAWAHQAAREVATGGYFHLEVPKTKGVRGPKSPEKIFKGPGHCAFQLKAPLISLKNIKEPGSESLAKEMKYHGENTGLGARVAPNAWSWASARQRRPKLLGGDYEVVRVSELSKIMAFGIFTTPALVVDGEVKVVGQVPGVDEVKKMIRVRRPELLSVTPDVRFTEDIREDPGQRIGVLLLPSRSSKGHILPDHSVEGGRPWKTSRNSPVLAQSVGARRPSPRRR